MNPLRANPAPDCPDLATGWTQRSAAALAAWIARGYFSLRVEGLENLPEDEPCILGANHCSHIDTFTIASALGRRASSLVFLAAHDYFSHFRFRGWLLRRLICLLPFRRGSGMAAAKHNLRMLARCRDARRIIVLFPEGTRSPDGAMREFKPGIALFADKLGLRVIPCHIEGAHAALPKGRSIPARTPLRLTLGRPMRLPPGAVDEGASERSERYAQFAADLQRAVVALGDAPADAVTLLGEQLS